MASSCNLDNAVLTQAAEWFAVLNDPNVSATERQNWKNWLLSNKDHQKAWDKVQHIESSFDQLPKEEASQALKANRTRQHTAFKNIISIAIVIPALWLCASMLENTKWFADHRTVVGEIEQLTQEEGTQIWLNTESALNVDYNQQQRRFKMIEGEILIHSAVDKVVPKRPLFVDSKQGRITALGTRFSVRQLSRSTIVTVFDGAISISPSKSQDSMTLHAGAFAEFNRHDVINKGTADLSSDSWSRGYLQADNQPLCDFVTILNRYHKDDLICSVEVAKYKLVGVYPIDNVSRVLRAIEASLPIRVAQVDDNTLRIEKR